MSNDERILQQLDHMEQDIALLTDSAKSLRELRDDLSPRVNEAVKLLIAELAQMESDLQLEDLLALLRNVLRNIRNLNWSLDQLKNLIDFVRTVEPLLKSSVPQAIQYLDRLEQLGVFQMLANVMGAVQKIAEVYTPEDIEQIASGLVPLLGVAKKLTEPAPLELLSKFAEVPGRVDLSRAKPVGAFGMLLALRDPKVKQGLGVVLEMTRGLSLLKEEATGENGLVSAAESDPQGTSGDNGKA